MHQGSSSSNPFESSPIERGDVGNGKPAGGSPFGSTSEELKSSAERLATEASRAISSGAKKRILVRLIEVAKAISAKLAEFGRKALELAINKFVIELCAMVMTALLAALTKKGYPGGIEISTGGVRYGGATGGGAAPTSTASSSPPSNPFASGLNSAFGSAW